MPVKIYKGRYNAGRPTVTVLDERAILRIPSWGSYSEDSRLTAIAVLLDITGDIAQAEQLAHRFIQDFLMLYHQHVDWEIHEEDIQQWLSKV